MVWENPFLARIQMEKVDVFSSKLVEDRLGLLFRNSKAAFPANNKNYSAE